LHVQTIVQSRESGSERLLIPGEMAKRIPINELRRQLQAMTESTRDTHVSQIKALRLSFSHSIEVQTDDSSPLAFNCVMYAFGLEDDARYIRLARQCLRLDPNHDADPNYQGVHADTSFVEFLIDKGSIVQVSSSSKGDMAVYFSGNRVKHIGRFIAPSRIASKWGMGHLYTHALTEVPSNYGGTLRYFTALSPNQTLSSFVAYAISRRIPLDAPQ
jgi:hypothetical protein